MSRPCPATPSTTRFSRAAPWLLAWTLLVVLPSLARPVSPPAWEGLWHQVGAVPLRLERGCASDVRVWWHQDGQGAAIEHQCRTADGEWLRHRAPVDGPDEQGRMRWRADGPLDSPLEVIGADDDGAWLLLGDGQRRWAWILTRAQHPAPADVEAAWARADAAGYPRAAWRNLPTFGRSPAEPARR